MSSIIIFKLHGDLIYYNPGHRSSSFHDITMINSGLEFKTIIICFL